MTNEFRTTFLQNIIDHAPECRKIEDLEFLESFFSNNPEMKADLYDSLMCMSLELDDPTITLAILQRPDFKPNDFHVTLAMRNAKCDTAMKILQRLQLDRYSYSWILRTTKSHYCPEIVTYLHAFDHLFREELFRKEPSPFDNMCNGELCGFVSFIMFYGVILWSAYNHWLFTFVENLDK